MTLQGRQELIQTFHYKLADECKLVKFFLMDNDVVFIPESLLRMSSSFLSAILKETLSFTKDLSIFLPEVDRRIISCIKNILLKGEGSLNTPNLKDVKAAAQNLGINFGSLSIEPSKVQVVVKDEPVIPKLEKIKNEPTEYFESDFENVTTEKTELEHIKVEKSPLKSPFSLNMKNNASIEVGKIEGTKDLEDRISNILNFYHFLNKKSKDLQESDIENATIEETKLENIDVVTTSEKDLLESDLPNVTIEETKLDIIEYDASCEKDLLEKSTLNNFEVTRPSLHLRTPSPSPPFRLPSPSPLVSSKAIHSSSPKQEEKHKQHKERRGSNGELNQKTSDSKSNCPVSKLPELKYIYISRYHKKCGKFHNRLDLCEKTLPHSFCGKRHGFGRECDGSWMSLEKFESLALKWPSTVGARKALEMKYSKNTQREDSHLIQNWQSSNNMNSKWSNNLPMLLARKSNIWYF